MSLPSNNQKIELPLFEPLTIMDISDHKIYKVGDIELKPNDHDAVEFRWTKDGFVEDSYIEWRKQVTTNNNGRKIANWIPFVEFSLHKSYKIVDMEFLKDMVKFRIDE